jgi:hypothetical protein
MEVRGRVQNGLVILEPGQFLPEGSEVVVVYVPSKPEPQRPQRVPLPLVPSDSPGTNRLTPEQIAQLLDESDVPT